jgi:hypothetical protein
MVALEGVPCVRIFPGMKPTLDSLSTVHRKYSPYRHDLNHAQPAGASGVWLKLMQTGTQYVQMKEVLPWFVRWASRTSTRDFWPALVALFCPIQNILFLYSTLFQLICPSSPSQRAGSRAGSPDT